MIDRMLQLADRSSRAPASLRACRPFTNGIPLTASHLRMTSPGRIADGVMPRHLRRCRHIVVSSCRRIASATVQRRAPATCVNLGAALSLRYAAARQPLIVFIAGGFSCATKVEVFSTEFAECQSYAKYAPAFPRARDSRRVSAPVATNLNTFLTLRVVTGGLDKGSQWAGKPISNNGRNVSCQSANSRFGVRWGFLRRGWGVASPAQAARDRAWLGLVRAGRLFAEIAPVSAGDGA